MRMRVFLWSVKSFLPVGEKGALYETAYYYYHYYYIIIIIIIIIIEYHQKTGQDKIIQLEVHMDE